MIIHQYGVVVAWMNVPVRVHTRTAYTHTHRHNPNKAKLIEEARRAERVEKLQEGINEFCVAGEWRRTPYAPRQYEAIQTYVPGSYLRICCIHPVFCWVCVYVYAYV